MDKLRKSLKKSSSPFSLKEGDKKLKKRIKQHKKQTRMKMTLQAKEMDTTCDQLNWLQEIQLNMYENFSPEEERDSLHLYGKQESYVPPAVPIEAEDLILFQEDEDQNLPVEEPPQVPPAVIHEVATPYRCEECGQGFGLRSLLTRHISSTHIKKFSLVCPVCTKIYKSLGWFTRHINKCH